MELNRELRQRCRLEVKHFVQDDSFGCSLPIWYCPFITSILTSSLTSSDII